MTTIELIYRQIENLSELKYGWDVDEKAPPPTITAIEKSKEIIKNIISEFNIIPEIAPDALGGVELIYKYLDKNLYINIFNNKYITITGSHFDDNQKSQSTDNIETVLKIFKSRCKIQKIDFFEKSYNTFLVSLWAQTIGIPIDVNLDIKLALYNEYEKIRNSVQNWKKPIYEINIDHEEATITMKWQHGSRKLTVDFCPTTGYFVTAEWEKEKRHGDNFPLMWKWLWEISEE